MRVDPPLIGVGWSAVALGLARVRELEQAFDDGWLRLVRDQAWMKWYVDHREQILPRLDANYLEFTDADSRRLRRRRTGAISMYIPLREAADANDPVIYMRDLICAFFTERAWVSGFPPPPVPGDDSE